MPAGFWKGRGWDRTNGKGSGKGLGGGRAASCAQQPAGLWRREDGFSGFQQLGCRGCALPGAWDPPLQTGAVWVTVSPHQAPPHPFRQDFVLD